jgi:hypothetical protein
MRLSALFAACLFAALSLPPLASTAAAGPGEHASGSIVMQAQWNGVPITLGGNIQLFRRGSLYRLDLLSLGVPGADPTISSLLGPLLGQSGATVIYDGASGAVSAYATGSHLFYESTPRGAVPVTAGPPPSAAAESGDPFALLAAIVRETHDMQHAAIELTGHSNVNGHPASDMAVTLQRTLPGKAPEDYHAQLELAEDLDGFPVRIGVTSTPATKDAIGGSVRLDLTTVERANPDDGVFAVPGGYTRVPSLGDVLRPTH